MQANREAYEQGLAEERAIRERRGREDGSEHQDRKIKGRVTVSFSLTESRPHIALAGGSGLPVRRRRRCGGL